jgi:hypothetical protein
MDGQEFVRRSIVQRGRKTKIKNCINGEINHLFYFIHFKIYRIPED